MSVLLADIVAASAAVAATRSRLEKRAAIAAVLQTASAEEIPIVVAYLSGRPLQDRLGVGWAAVSTAPDPADAAALSVCDVDTALEAIATTSGAGSVARRTELLSGLLGAATAPEQDFLRRLILRELRQGATDGLMIEAIAAAADLPAADVRRTAMLSGSLVEAGVLALTMGAMGIAGVRLRVLTPVQPMLASIAEDVGSAVAGLGEASIEVKLDGARIQVHKGGDTVLVVTRNLRDVTDRVPEVVEAAAAFPLETAILDGEVLVLRPDGRPLPFQETMGRFGAKLDVATARGVLPLSPFFFDVLHADGVDLLDEPLETRYEVLDRLPHRVLVPRIITSDPDEAERFFAATLEQGHEGVMVKDLTAPYAAGRRGSGWLKVKPAHTLDLVVLAVEWGSGRRKGWLSNLHLGARDPDGGHVMLGKTFKGLTDEMLQWQTERFLELETRREGHVVYVRPEQVVEIAFDGVQASSRYPGGMALRFARVKGYRDDKPAEEADTIETVRALFGRSRG